MWKEPKSDHAAASCDQTGVGGGKGKISLLITGRERAGEGVPGEGLNLITQYLNNTRAFNTDFRMGGGTSRRGA